jgi:hypothetical protein
MGSVYEKITRWIRHNQSMTIGLVLALIMAIWFFGCESRTRSLVEPGVKVTEDELNIEYTSELARLESEMQTLRSQTEVRLQDLQRQDAFKQALFANAVLIAEGGNPNPLGILSMLGTIFGISAIIDNRRKDGIIKGMKPPSS